MRDAQEELMKLGTRAASVVAAQLLAMAAAGLTI